MLSDVKFPGDINLVLEDDKVVLGADRGSGSFLGDTDLVPGVTSSLGAGNSYSNSC